MIGRADGYDGRNWDVGSGIAPGGLGGFRLRSNALTSENPYPRRAPLPRSLSDQRAGEPGYGLTSTMRAWLA